MPLSKAKNRVRMRAHRAAIAFAKLGPAPDLGTVVIPAAEVRRLARAGLTVEQWQEAGSSYAALLLDRDAIKMHLDAHHEAKPHDIDVLTRIERLELTQAVLYDRITLLEAERVADIGWAGDVESLP
mgnify:CR=1 FL=1